MSTSTDLNALIKSIDNVNVESLSTGDRAKLYNASRTLFNKSSQPWNIWFRFGFSELAVLAAAKVCLDLKVFEAWSDGGGDHKTATELANITTPKCDPALMERLLRLLASANMVESVEGDKYALAAFSKSFRDDASLASAQFTFDVLPLFQNLPRFLKATGYKNPADSLATNFTTAFGFDGTFFDYAAQNPEFAKNFNLMVKWMHAMEPPWTEIFPTETLLPAKNAASSAPILVDVGGGLGEAVRLFAKKHGIPRESLVLQDTQAVLEHAQMNNFAVPMEIDFFKPQPVKGASAYLLSHILHDWPDHLAKSILSNIKSAMVPGKSKILVYDVVLRDDPTDIYGPTMDVLMMTALSSNERTPEMWKTLIEPVGLKITKIHFHPTASHAVIEIEIDEHASK